MIANFYIKDGDGFKETKLRYCADCMRTHMEHRETCWHCGPWRCSDCGSEMPDSMYTNCSECREKSRALREKEMFDNAEKLTEWDGPVYDGSEYYESLEAFCEQTRDDGNECPAYVWTCNCWPVVNLNKDMLTDDGVVQESYEDFDPDDIVIPDSMIKAMEEFNEANKELVSWSPNFKKAVLIKQEVPNA